MFWDSPAEWREAQIGLGVPLHFHALRAGKITQITEAIAEKIQSLDPVLERLCIRTCFRCDDPCCVRATVRYDFRDLVFLHLIRNGLPLGQPKTVAGKACSCLGKNGCLIDRLMRPFMCTWYLCPRQMHLLRTETFWRKFGLPDRLREIQDDRKKMENEYLKLVEPH